MRQIDWTLILFVSSTLLHEYWLLSGLPRIYFWDGKRQLNEGDEDRKIA
ncbi:MULTISPECIES: hypothetical protein [Gracilibacillus]|nr:hypothetical protein [Gracilibacillus dipsosauri]